MRRINLAFKKMVAEVPADIKAEVDLSFAIADRLDFLIKIVAYPKKNLPKLSANDQVK